MWLRWRNGFGFPHAGGWADQLAWVWEAIEGFELARADEKRISDEANADAGGDS